VYQAADERPMYLSAIDPDSWRRFCDATGHAELRDLWPKAARIDYGGPELFEAVAAVFRERTAAQWMAVFAEARVAATPLLTEAEVMTSVQLDRSGMRYGGGDATGLSGPVWWRGENGSGRPGDRRAPAPQLGADNESVRARWLEA
jgi:alpha-methylacyl-CoA racemase